jgi:hypothetical protein
MKLTTQPPIATSDLIVQTVTRIVIFLVNEKLKERNRDTLQFFCRTGPQCLPHAGFYTQAQRDGWLAMRGLSIEGQRATGSFRIAQHRSAEAFHALPGEAHLCLDQDDYTRAIVTADSDGVRTVHLLLPDCGREVLDFATSDRLDRAGRTALTDSSFTDVDAEDRKPEEDPAGARAVQAFRETLGLPPRGPA